MLAVSARDGNADTQRPMVIGETIGWKAHATETSEQSMECMSDVRASDVAKRVSNEQRHCCDVF